MCMCSCLYVRVCVYVCARGGVERARVCLATWINSYGYSLLISDGLI